MSNFFEVVFSFYIWVYFDGNSRKKVILMTIRNTMTDTSSVGDVQRRLNGYLSDVRGMNNHIVNSDIKGEATIKFRNED